MRKRILAMFLFMMMLTSLLGFAVNAITEAPNPSTTEYDLHYNGTLLPARLAFTAASDLDGRGSTDPAKVKVYTEKNPSFAVKPELTAVTGDVWNMQIFDNRITPTNKKFYGEDYDQVAHANNEFDEVRLIQATIPNYEGQRYSKLVLGTTYSEQVEDGSQLFAIDDRFSMWYGNQMYFRQGSDMGDTNFNGNELLNEWGGWITRVSLSNRTIDNPTNGTSVDLFLEDYCDAGGMVESYLDGSREYYLDARASEGGYLENDDPDPWYEEGRIMPVMAIARVGYHLAGWATNPQSDEVTYTSSTNLIRVKMDGPIYVKAIFQKDDVNQFVKLTKTVNGKASDTVALNSTVQYKVVVDNSAHNYSIQVASLNDKMNQEPSTSLLQGKELIIPAGEKKEFLYSKSFSIAGTYTNVVELKADIVFASDEARHLESPESIENMKYDIVLSATATVYVIGSDSTPTPTPPPQTIQYPLTVTVDGPGTVLPFGTANYSANSVVVLSPSASPNAHFVGWVGTNGSEVANDRITITGVKSIIAKFEADEIIIEPTPVPLASPVIEAASTPKPIVEEQKKDEEVISDVVIPLDKPELPKTGGLPTGILTVLGIVMTGTGLFTSRKR